MSWRAKLSCAAGDLAVTCSTTRPSPLFSWGRWAYSASGTGPNCRPGMMHLLEPDRDTFTGAGTCAGAWVGSPRASRTSGTPARHMVDVVRGAGGDGFAG